ncbi:uncharacterized protein LOC125035220 isoform X3 [Penaeus chinensis]|uniref:uncharacterized protein LOC125035220 isoform X3 n=1 Tax=Penaeus chinensis TaxID=139456 RepID=UPI001FB809F2|nr:uncharacterized protein LOC125035220 isoform X3 [Penaeus chinensis]
MIVKNNLFPYFSTVKTLPTAIWRAVYMTRGRDSFLTNYTSRKVRERLVILNPAHNKVSKQKKKKINRRMKAFSTHYMRNPELIDDLLQGNAELDTWLGKETNWKIDVTSVTAVESAANANNGIVSASSIASLAPEVHEEQETINTSSETLKEIDENRQGDIPRKQTNTLSTNRDLQTHRTKKKSSRSVPSKEKKTSPVKGKIVSASSTASLAPEVHEGQETVNTSSETLKEIDENRQGDIPRKQTNTLSTSRDPLTHRTKEKSSSGVPSKEKKTSPVKGKIVPASSTASLAPEVHEGQETVNTSSETLKEIDENRQGDIPRKQTNTYSANSGSQTHHTKKKTSSSIPSKEKKTSPVKCKLVCLPKTNTCLVLNNTVKPVASQKGKDMLAKLDLKAANTELGKHSVSFVQDVNQNGKPAENHISDAITPNCAINTDSVKKVQNYSDEFRERWHTKESNHIRDEMNLDNVIFSQTQDSQLPVITEVVSIAASQMDEMCSEEDNRENEIIKDIYKGKPQEKNNVNLKRCHDSSQTIDNSKSKYPAAGHPKRRKNVVNEEENNFDSLGNEVEVQLVKKRPVVMPELSECIKNWQKVFPWVTYCEKQTLICEACKWGSTDPGQFKVFVLSEPSEVYQTAKILRCHDESQKHNEFMIKKLQIQKLFRHVYSLLKGTMKDVSGLEGLTEKITNLEGGVFPGPQRSLEKDILVSYMVKHIATCLQNRQLKALKRSPYFSVLAFEKNSLAIIRWLNQRGECEEHLLSVNRCIQEKELSVKEYLEYKNVDLQKMSLYADIPHMRNLGLLDKLVLPARLPSLKKCLSWLESNHIFKDLFYYLEEFTKLCKGSPFKFANFPETEEVLQLEKPYSHNCLRSASILSFLFKNSLKLKELACTIYDETGSLKALEFSTLDLTHTSAFRIADALFPRLHAVFAKKEHSQASIMEITALRKIVASMLKCSKSEDSEEVTVLSILDIFLSYTLLSLHSHKDETLIFFTMRLQQVTTFVMEKVFERFMKEFKGSSCELLQDVHAVRTLLGKQKSCTVLDLFTAFGEKPDLFGDFPKLHEFYLKLKVLPFLTAKVELSMFDIALTYGTLTPKFPRTLVMAMAYISIEGPSPKEIDEDYILREWSSQWKMGIEKKLDK